MSNEYIEREIKKLFEKITMHYKIIALVGARQSGKTTFLKEEGKKFNTNYVLFDDPDARNLFEEDIKKFETQYVKGRELTILDEVQYCREAGRNLKYLADNGNNIWITSSTDLILGRDVLSFLVGRVSVLKLYPFSLREFLLAKKQKEVNKEILKRCIWEHAMFGGYPKVILAEDIEIKKIILKDLYETMLLKDIAQAFSIDDIKSLETFTKYISLSVGGLVSYDVISNNLGVSFQTVKKYFDALEKSNLIIMVQPFFTNKLKEIVKQPKAYFIDNGIRSYISKQYMDELDGKMFENYVLTEIIKQGIVPKYWRSKSKNEVDFIIEKDSEIMPIEVKLVNPDKIPKSLVSFIREYKPKRAIVVYYKGEDMKKIVDGCEVTFTDALQLGKYFD